MRPFGIFLSCFNGFGDARRMSVSLPATGSPAIAHSGDSEWVSFTRLACRAVSNKTGPVVA